MVEFTPDGCRVSLEECGAILDAALWKGSSRDRARLARAVHHGIGGQVLRAIRTSSTSGKFEKPTTVDVPLDVIQPVLDSLRPTVDSTGEPVDPLQEVIAEFDQKYEDYRREQINGKFVLH